MKKNINYLLFLLFTIVSIFSVQSVKADSSQCTIYITGGSADSVIYSYSDVLKKCRITPPYSNPKVTLHSGTKHIAYNKVSYNFTLSGLKDLKSATSEYVDITFRHLLIQLLLAFVVNCHQALIKLIVVQVVVVTKK